MIDNSLSPRFLASIIVSVGGGGVGGSLSVLLSSRVLGWGGSASESVLGSAPLY